MDRHKTASRERVLSDREIAKFWAAFDDAGLLQGTALKLTPHDLRRTHGTTIAALGFGRDAMNWVQNHKEGGIGSVYDRHQYADENKRVMEAVAARILLLATGETQTGNVAQFKRHRIGKCFATSDMPRSRKVHGGGWELLPALGGTHHGEYSVLMRRGRR